MKFGLLNVLLFYPLDVLVRQAGHLKLVTGVQLCQKMAMVFEFSFSELMLMVMMSHLLVSMMMLAFRTTSLRLHLKLLI